MIDYLHTRMGKENEEERDKDTRCPTLPLHSIPLFCVVLCVLAVLEWESTTYAKAVMFPPSPRPGLLLMTSGEWMVFMVTWNANVATTETYRVEQKKPC